MIGSLFTMPNIVDGDVSAEKFQAISAAAPQSSLSLSSPREISMINDFDDYRLLQNDNNFNNNNNNNLFPRKNLNNDYGKQQNSLNQNHESNTSLFDLIFEDDDNDNEIIDNNNNTNDYDYNNILKDETITVQSSNVQYFNLNDPLTETAQEISSETNLINNENDNKWQPSSSLNDNSFLFRSYPLPSWSQQQKNQQVSVTYNRRVSMPDALDVVDSDSRKSFQCNWLECFMNFSSLNEFVRHVEMNHVDSQKNSNQSATGRYLCRWSNCRRELKPFDQCYKLINHMRTHTGEKPKKCLWPGCGKMFPRQENLKIHLRSHTNERPYRCLINGCQKSFSSSSALAKHRPTHLDPKPFACDYPDCNKKYTDPSSLRKHKKNNHFLDLCSRSLSSSTSSSMFYSEQSNNQNQRNFTMDLNDLSKSWSGQTDSGLNFNNNNVNDNVNLCKTWSNYQFYQNQQSNNNNNQMNNDNLPLIQSDSIARIFNICNDDDDPINFDDLLWDQIESNESVALDDAN